MLPSPASAISTVWIGFFPRQPPGLTTRSSERRVGVRPFWLVFSPAVAELESVRPRRMLPYIIDDEITEPLTCSIEVTIDFGGCSSPRRPYSLQLATGSKVLRCVCILASAT